MLPSEEIKEKINLVDLIGEYVTLKRAGVNFRALCPFHEERTASFTVSPSKQIWHCFGCGLGGDIFEFVKQMEGVEFGEALQILAVRAGVPLRSPAFSAVQTDQNKTLYAINDWAAKFYAKILAESPLAAPAREYLQKRGFKAETIRLWQLGFAPDGFHTFENFIVKKGYQKKEAFLAGLLAQKEGQSPAGQDEGYFDRFRERIMFPLFDHHGRVVGFTARILEAPTPQGVGTPTATVGAKYVNSPETPIYSKSRLLYGLHLAKNEIRKRDEVMVVEGNVDVITCHEAGFTHVVGSSGTALTEKQAEALRRFTKNLTFALDVDEAGEEATRRALEKPLALGFNVKIIALPKDAAKDPDELIRGHPAVWAEAVKNRKHYLDYYFERIFANMKPDALDEKKKARDKFLYLLAILPDALDRTHYLKRLAEKLGYEERELLQDLKEFRQAPAAPRAEQNAPRDQQKVLHRGKQEVLEQLAIGYLLKSASARPEEWRGLSPEDFTSPAFREIYEHLGAVQETQNFALVDFLAGQPRLAPAAELAIFAFENFALFAAEEESADFKRKLYEELKIGGARRKMQELSRLIRQAEAAGRVSEAKNLSTEFNSLSKELAKYHVR